MNKERESLIKEIKKSVPTVGNLASNIHQIEKFVKVQDLIVELSEIGFEDELNVVVNVFKEYFQPIILNTLTFEVDFIKVVEPVLLTPKVPFYASQVLEKQMGLSLAYSYNSVLNKLICPTETEKKLGQILFIQNSSELTGLKNTSALRIAISTLRD